MSKNKLKKTKKLHEALLNATHHLSEKICMQVHTAKGWYRYSYSELRKKTEQASQLLKEIGISPGDRIILLTENCPDAMIAFLAILSADAVVVLLDPALPTNELNQLIAHTEARAVLISERYLKNLEPLTLPVAVRNIQNNFDSCEGHRAETDPVFITTYFTDADVAAILYTSGTTDFAKGVMLTHDNFLKEIQQSQLNCPATENDQMLTVLPIHHISPLLQTLMGLSVGLTATCVEKLESSSILTALQETHSTLTGFVPLIYEAFLREIEKKISQQNKLRRIIAKTLFYLSKNTREKTGFNLGFYLFKKIHSVFGGHLTRMISGGAALNPAVLSKLEAYGFTIIEAYGLTETSGPICSSQMRQKKTGFVGVPFADTEIRIVDEEICVRGPSVMKGYFKDASATNQILKNGWLHTGDLGSLDSNGFLKITGRKREMIVLSSGKKIIPTELEQYYKSIAGIKEIAIFSVPTQGNEQIHAAIVIDEAKQESVAEMIYQKSSQLPAHFHIQFIYFVNEIPKTTSLKTKRVQLQKQVLQKVILPFEFFKTKNSTQEATAIFATANSDETILSILQRAPTSEQPKILRHELKKMICTVMGLNEQQLDDQTDFDTLGMDSFMALELHSLLEKDFFPDLLNPSGMILGHKNIDRLAKYIEEKISKENNIASPSRNPRKLTHLHPAEENKIATYAKQLFNPRWFTHGCKSIVRNILGFLCRFYFRIEMKGLENLPKNQCYIICPNHTSYLDSVVLGAVAKKINHPFVGLLAEDYFSKKSFPLISLIIDAIPFDRSRNEYALLKNLKYIELCKNANRVLILFPEGTRSKDGQLQEFKNGAAWFAEQTQLEVIPAYIHGGYRLLPSGRFFPKPGKLTIHFGKALQFSTDQSKSFSGMPFYQHMTQKLRDSILELSTESI